ncbi:response regulator [Algibacillus agarilyticus]|uniref:response regulator n=1 Tax=Algibacillus agarilyticus TaxID=2234133 RepID=UPI000DCFA696|nr:response regulator [Algibacillus agarilyticus]
MLILLVDDNAKIRHDIKLSLTSDGHEVICAENGLTAWSLMQKNEFDFVITDHIMPIMNGITLVDNILRADKLTANKLVVLSTKIDAVIKHKLAKYGVALMSKPVSYNSLKNKLNTEQSLSVA